MNNKKLQLFILLLIIGITFALRFYNLSHIPPGIHGDEAEWGLIERKVNRGEYESFFSLGNTGQYFDFSILSYFVQGLFLRLFGDTVFGIRASSAFAGTLTVLAFYFLAKQLLRNNLAILLSTFALATSHWHIAYSRLALLNIWTPLFMVLVFTFLLKALRSEKRLDFIITGIFLGISLYFHHTIKVVPVILLAFTATVLLFKKTKKASFFLNICILSVTAGLVFFPQAMYYFTHPGTFSPRLNEVSVFNHLAEYYTRYNVDSISGVLFWQFINTLKVFNFGGDIGFYFYGYQGGLLAPIAGILAVAGLLICFLRIKRENNLLLLTWFLAVIILGGTITIDAPSSQRLLGVIPVLFLFIGTACEKILKLRIPYIKTILVILFILNGLWDYKIYFINYLNTQAGWAQREPATQISYYLQSLGPNWKVYMLKEEFWYTFNHGPIKFLNPELEGEDVTDSKSVIPNTKPTTKNIVYIMPPNSPSLDRLRHFYPQGKAEKFFNPIGNTPSFASFEVQSNMLE